MPPPVVVVTGGGLGSVVAGFVGVVSAGFLSVGGTVVAGGVSGFLRCRTLGFGVDTGKTLTSICGPSLGVEGFGVSETGGFAGSCSIGLGSNADFTESGNWTFARALFPIRGPIKK